MIYIKYYEELNKELNQEVDIIYRDPNLICLMPKSQKASKIYGKGTNWCQTSKIGFELWTSSLRNNNINFIIRFIFKNVNGKPRKLRFTYEPDTNNFHWAIENGKHYFKSCNSDDIFNLKIEPKLKKDEKDIINLISLIPIECKEKVNSYIFSKKDLRKNNFFKYSDTEYLTKKDKDFTKEIEKLKIKYNLSYYPIDIEILNTLKTNVDYYYYNNNGFLTRRLKVNLNLLELEKEIKLFLINFNKYNTIDPNDLKNLEAKYKNILDIKFHIRENKIKLFVSKKNTNYPIDNTAVYTFNDVDSCEKKIQDIINNNIKK